jgi:HD-GYP domain-containing protein (c-di-GMP phosphodiesterase class II)
MWKKPGKAIRAHYSQLVVGMYITLKENWNDHPFLYNDFLLNNQKKIDTIQALKLDKIYYYPDKSSAPPGPLILPPTEAVAVPAAESTNKAQELAEQEELARLKLEKKAKIRKQKDAAARADRGWEKAAQATREALLELTRSPKQAGEKLVGLSRESASIFAGGQEILLHLLGDKNSDGPQFHALNVMTLSMLLGKISGMNESQLADLALGALAHDAGKARVPAHLLKMAVRAKHEEAFYRQHGAYGAEVAKESGVFNNAALEVITDHHEAMDGTGWPKGKTKLSLAARIVALVDRYDRLSNPESPEREALMPTTALAKIFKTELKQFDPALLSILIKMLGIYPPGTIVQLNDGALGMVVSPGRESLRPKVLVYNPDLPKEEAATVDLSQEPDLKIEEALKPSSLPPEALAWLNPRKRLSYFYSTEGNTI